MRSIPPSKLLLALSDAALEDAFALFATHRRMALLTAVLQASAIIPALEGPRQPLGDE